MNLRLALFFLFYFAEWKNSGWCWTVEEGLWTATINPAGRPKDSERKLDPKIVSLY